MRKNNTPFGLQITLTRFPPLAISLSAVHPGMEFHIQATARSLYECTESLFSSSGNLIFPNFRAVRAFTQKMIEKGFPSTKPEVATRAGQVNAMGLIDEIYHYIVRMYDEVENPGVLRRVYDATASKVGIGQLRMTLEAFVELCPPLAVYQHKITPKVYCAEEKNLLSVFEELLLLNLENFNPAFRPWRSLFDDTPLVTATSYSSVVDAIESLFAQEKRFGPDHQTLLELLRAPILAHPDSLDAQLRFIQTRWGMVLSDAFLAKMLGGMDVLSEESKIIYHGPHDPPSIVPTYKPAGPEGAESVFGSHEMERFTADIDWMPKVVLLAKNTYVWLNQLSKKYQRSITRLDQIPDQELDQIAHWNFTGLWLIGIWERSIASQRIKNYTGNPDAVPSAYSLYEYEIASDLGGEEAFQNLNHRAWQRGIRLAGDMVPNHMGIYSKWMVEHPEYFIQLDYSPFPGYRFTGGDLSDSSVMQVRIEDGYWSRTDAAVVFQRIDNITGAVRYIYHGNDGTNMPWNDTAQLDLLKAEVREAVIQEIFRVARKFSIIRFDAAMTLAKKHYQRLWYPQPGTGGAIPSRSEHALTRARFDELFPHEFWREVVDRINAEMPHTLLLAEAFWLMEGYFVRTLGMHRVYNSAFMHMLMKEENDKYRQLIKNTLDFDPEILKRYVNFMSNPDEQTAIAQFGKDDKYFGIALMMVTLPGLPMFGHGQIEGFTEKYGMEYKRAYYDEHPDEHLVRRHEQEIFPIMKKRHLFSQVENFELYDFYDHHGHLNENVFAYSNRRGDERALILYHNHYSETSGRIGRSVPKLAGEGGSKRLRTVTLGEGLHISADPKMYYSFRDHKGHLEFLRSGSDICEHGFYVELKAFQYHVFLDFHEMYDVDGSLEHLCGMLQGKGVPDIHAASLELRREPLYHAFRLLLEKESITALEQYTSASAEVSPEFDSALREKCRIWNEKLHRYYGGKPEVADILGHLPDDIETMRRVGQLLAAGEKLKHHILGILSRQSREEFYHIALAWLASQRLSSAEFAQLVQEHGTESASHLRLEKVVREQLLRSGVAQEKAAEAAELFSVLRVFHNRTGDLRAETLVARLDFLLNDFSVREFLRLNWYEGIWYYNREAYQKLMEWLFVLTLFHIAEKNTSMDMLPSEVERGFEILQKLIDFSDKAEYDLQRLEELIAEEAPWNIT